MGRTSSDGSPKLTSVLREERRGRGRGGEGRGGRGGTPLREWAVARVKVVRGWSARLIGRPVGRPGACTYPCQRTRVGADC